MTKEEALEILKGTRELYKTKIDLLNAELRALHPQLAALEKILAEEVQRGK